jgi:CBS domain-containing protein
MTQPGLIDLIGEISSTSGVDIDTARKVSDIMQTDIRTLTLDDTIKHCLDVMKANRIRHIPVIDLPREGESRPFFVGIVSQRDLLRLKPPKGKASDEDGVYPQALRQLLGQVVTRKPWTTSPEAAIAEVIRLILDKHIDMVPVLRDDHIIGIITTTDMLRLLVKVGDTIEELRPALEKDSRNSATAGPILRTAALTVESIMIKDVTCLGEDSRLVEAMEIFRGRKIRHVLITDECGRLKGIVSDRDVLGQLPYAGPHPKGCDDFRADLFRVQPGTESLDLTLQEIMTTSPKIVAPDCSVFGAARTIFKLRVGCLPVVTGEGEICGIVTVADFMKFLLSMYETSDLPPQGAK